MAEGLMGMIQPITQFVTEQPIIGIPAITIALLFLVAKIYNEYFKESTDFEETTQEERMVEGIDQVVDEWGDKPKRRILHKWKSDKYVLKVIERGVELEENYVKSLDDSYSFEFAVMKYRDTGLLKKIGYTVTDKFLGFEIFTKKLVVDTEDLEIGHFIKINDDVQFDYRNGFYLPRGLQGVAFELELSYQSFVSDLIKLFMNQSEALHGMNIKHTEEVRLDKKEQEHISKAINEYKRQEKEEATD